MADTTNPIIPPAQDLQINLDDTAKPDASLRIDGDILLPENKQSGLNLDLDLNLPDAPKDDDRLKNEDLKNNETAIPQPTMDIPAIEDMPVQEAEQ